MADILILTIVIMLVSSSILSWYLAVNHVRLQRDRYELDKYDLNINTDIKLGQLDEFITTTLDEYIYQTVPANSYINQIECKKLIRECVDIISSRMTQPLRDQLSIFYNEEALDAIIVEKVLVYVKNFVNVQNASTVKTK